MKIIERPPLTVTVADSAVTVHIPGQPPATGRCAQHRADGYDLWVADTYGDNTDRYAAQARDAVAAAPRALREHLNLMVIMGCAAPGRPNGIACAEHPGILIFWAAAANDHRPYLAQTTVDHELAHLAGDEGRPPADMGDLWTQVRHADARHGARLSEKWFGIRGQVAEFAFEHMQLTVGDVWLSERCEREAQINGEAEDWATSVSCHLASRRAGHLATVDGQPLTFADLYPFRARLIDAFLCDNSD